MSFQAPPSDSKFDNLQHLMNDLNKTCLSDYLNPNLLEKCKMTEPWEALTSPQNHDLLIEWINQCGGLEKLNATAQKFYGAALKESAERKKADN